MAQAPSHSLKSLKRGELLIKSGERPQSVYIVTSGAVSILQAKSGKNVELLQASDAHTIGEELILSPTQWGGGFAVALKDTAYYEFPLASLKEQTDNLPPAKAFLKGVLDRAKSTANELKEIHFQKGRSPCPGESTARVFGVILHSAKAKAKPEGKVLVADWLEFKNFATGIFKESPSRLEEAIFLLVKLGYVELDVDAAGKTGKVRFKDLVPVENFFEFFYSYYFKGTGAEMLKINEKAARITDEFLKIAENYEMNRAGMVSMPFKPTIEAMKTALDGRFEPDQLFALQHKGLMVKLTTTDEGGVLSFYKQDFLQMLINWRFLKEVELWNERGFVDRTPVPDPTIAREAEAKEATAGVKAAPAPRKAPQAGGTPSPAKEATQKPRELKPPTNAVRMFKPGEFLYKAGEPADRLFLLQSGLVSLIADKRDGEINVGQATAPQLIGEEALYGNAPWTLSAIAINDTEAMEMSVPEAKAMIESLPGSLKVLIKSVLKKQKSVAAELLVAKLEAGVSEACPHEVIPKLFAIIYHAATSTGTVKNGCLTVVWPAFRKYCHWGLLESPVRLEQVMQILAKLGYATLELVKCETDPEAPDELGFVHFKDIELIHGFYGFYQEKGTEGIEATLKAITQTAGSAKDPLLQKYLAILKEIRAWNAQGKVEAAADVPKAA